MGFFLFILCCILGSVLLNMIRRQDHKIELLKIETAHHGKCHNIFWERMDILSERINNLGEIYDKK